MPLRHPPVDDGLRHTNVGRKLLLAFDAFEQRIVEGIRARGFEDFKPSDGAALRNVPLDGCKLSEIAARAHMTKQGMSLLVRELEGRGYLEVAPDPDDRRARRVALTSKGRGLLKAGRETYVELRAEWVERLGDRGFRQLERLLDRVVEPPSGPVSPEPDPAAGLTRRKTPTA